MAEIKRPNYFTFQFLGEKDFNDEQAYHLNMRRRLNRVQHTFGVANGFAVTRVSTTQIAVGAGTAIDKDGREIVLDDPLTYTLTTAGSNLDVYLTIGYQDVPTDHYNQAGIDKFTRTAERPLLQDGTAVPPTDGSVIVLARIRLSASATIESDGSIDTTVRTLAGARIAPNTVGVDELTEDAVTLARLDAQGGANRIVSQINAGTGVIASARTERVMVTGVVTFNTLPFGQEQFSDEIDSGLGDGPLSLELAVDDLPSAGLTLAGGGSIAARTVLNRSTGRFRVFATRTVPASPGAVRIRWYAFKLPSGGSETTVDVSVQVSPSQVSMAGNATQVLTATVNNATNLAVTWSPPPPGSTLTPNGLTATFISPGLSGDYEIKVTSVADPSKSGSAIMHVTAAIAVNLSQLTANLVTGGQVTLSATVINTTNAGINWSIVNNAGGSLSAASGPSTTFTAPAAPGSYTVRAASAADNTKKADCIITVSAVSISVFADTNPIPGNGSTVVRATITPSFVDQNADWTLQGSGSLSTPRGPTTTYFAPNSGGSFRVTGKSVADPSKSQFVDIIANPVSTGPGGPPGGKFGPPGPEGLQPVNQENIAVESDLPVDVESAAPSSAASTTKKTARTFIRPSKRPK